MENMENLSVEELKDVNGGAIDPVSVAALVLAAAWCCYELGVACAAYDQRHKL